AAQIGVKRIPVALAKKDQGRPGFLRLWIAGGNYEGPSRRRELGWSRKRVHGLAVCHEYSDGYSAKQDKEFCAEKLQRRPRAWRIPLSRSSRRGLSGPRLSKVRGKSHRQLSPWPYRPIGRTPCRVASAPVRRSGPAPRGHDDRESSETRPPPPGNG